MATVICTPRLREVGPATARSYPGDNLLELLDALAVDYPRLRGYLLDDQGRLRRHVAIFVGGQMVPRDQALTWPVSAGDEVYLMQALSGG